MAPIIAFVEALHTSSEPVVWHSLHCSPPGLLTVTPTYGELRLSGLHVDHWDALPLDDLHAARNRICINLGTQDRFFLFVNLDAAEIQRRVIEKRPEKRRDHTSRDPQQNMESLVSDLCDTFPDYPVVKLRVGPDEAYIAPTEQIIHDGNTEGGAFIDIDLMARGRFNPMGGLPDRVSIQSR